MFLTRNIERTLSRSLRAVLLASATLAAPSLAWAADAEGDAEADEREKSSREIVVIADIGFRNRSDDAQPVLVYDEEYFQRFEPLTAGDALKRVPSVTFLSDVLESDGARLRGLDPGYTQILVNGEKVPGSNIDRSFFLDRIPAELVERVEIVRSPSARRTSDAVAGTLNIVLRDAFAMDGGYVRAGMLSFEDGEIKPSGGIYYGGKLGPGRLLVGANIQGRYSPKVKKSLRYSDSPENNPDYAADDFDNREDQSDVRNGTDYAGNISWGFENGNDKFEISGNYVRTEREQIERSYEYDDPMATSGPVRTSTGGHLLTDNYNPLFITQESWAVAGKLDKEWSGGITKLRLGYARFDDRQDEFEHEIDFDRSRPRYTGDLTLFRVRDTDISLGLEHVVPLDDGLDFSIGGFAQNKDRSTDISAVRNRFNLTTTAVTGYDQFVNHPQDFGIAFPATVAEPGGLNTIEEDRRDLYVMVEGKRGAAKFELGLRWESTKVTIDDKTVVGGRSEMRYDFLMPSASVKFDLGDGRITASAARTMRRPRFDYISPALLEAELGDNDLLGNPQLRPETAWGGDLGYEHKLGRTGVVGVNVFYRRIDNLIETVNTGAQGSEGAGTWIYQPRNVGNGEVWGIEFDLSASLGLIGLPDTGVFGNLALIDSSVQDGFGSRRFNGQSKYVYNVGVIQNLPKAGISLGVTYRKQGPAFDRNVGEEVTTTYGADLEVFVEKRLGDRLTLRFVGSNLLDSSKDEVFNKFTTIGNQTARVFDEYELETESAGPVFQVVARYAF